MLDVKEIWDGIMVRVFCVSLLKDVRRYPVKLWNWEIGQVWPAGTLYIHHLQQVIQWMLPNSFIRLKNAEMHKELLQPIMDHNCDILGYNNIKAIHDVYYQEEAG